MKKNLTGAIACCLLACVAGSARADITIGVSIPLTGPASGLGIPVDNEIKLWPTSIAGEKLRVIVLDDATDPTKGVQNIERLVSENHADVVVGSVATPVAVAIAGPLADSGTPQLMLSPGALPPGKDLWTFRLAQSNGVMAHAMLEHMKREGVKSVGFLGYADAYGEGWLKAFQDEAATTAPDIRIVATERFARSDTSVTGQVLKLVSVNPDAILIVASGSGAAMPHMAVIERGYKGKVYQTHAAASRDLIRLGGRSVEGAFVVSGPAVVAEQLQATNPSKAVASDFVEKYEKIYGPGSRNQFAAHGYDVALLLQKAIPIALKSARPGTPEFRVALRNAFERMGTTIVSQGVLQYSKDDHWGYTNTTGVMLKIVNGDWKVE